MTILPALQLEHRGQHALAAMEHAFDIDVEHPLPFRFGNILELLLLGDASVVDQNIDGAEGLKHRFDHFPYLALLRYIRPKNRGIPLTGV